MGLTKPRAIVKCVGCESDCEVSDVSQHWAMCNGKALRFTVFKCDKCGTWNVCQIDDAECIKLLGKITKCLAVRAKSGQSEKLSGRYRKLQGQLNERRKNLNASYEGKKILFTDIEKTIDSGWVICNVL